MCKVIVAEGLLYTRCWLKASLPKRTANCVQQSWEETKIVLNQIEELFEKCEGYRRASNKEIDVLKVGHCVEALLIPKGDFLPTRIYHSAYQLE